MRGGLEQRRAATIRDVAEKAGVSRAAVSKVLRDAYGVSPAMRSRVTFAMEELDYRPKVAARAMRGQSYTIGIEIPDFGNQFFTRMLAGASQALENTPFQLVVAPAEEGSRNGLRAIEALIDRQVDGLIAVAPRVSQAELERIGVFTPLVMFGRHDRSDFYDTVVGGDADGARLAMSHLIERGHRRIAHLTIEESDPSDALPHGIRLRAYQEVMEANGLASFTRVIRADEGQEAAAAATLRALDEDDSTTAIFAAHDELAIGVLRATLESGRKIAVIGYDDVPIASHPALKLSTVGQPGVEMGRRAVSRLLERIAGRDVSTRDSFDPELIIRASSAARDQLPEPVTSN